MEKLILNGCTYYHTTVTTSMFGGASADSTLMKIDQTGQIIRLSSEQWNYDLETLMTEDHWDKSFDMVYNDPFIDYR